MRPKAHLAYIVLGKEDTLISKIATGNFRYR